MTTSPIVRQAARRSPGPSPGRRQATALAARVLAVLAAGVLALTLPLGLLEIGFRTFGPFLPGEYNLGIEREFDPVLGWHHRPNFVGGNRTSEFNVRFSINSKGLRDEEFPYEKPVGGFRILALGDSFLAAAHVPLEQAMTKQLQALLRQQRAPRPVDVVNAGVAGYGTAQEYLYLDAEGYRYQPDIVLLVVFLGNDLNDNIRSEDARYDRPVFEVDGENHLKQTDFPERDPARRTSWDDFLVRNSTVYNFLLSGVLRKLDPANNQTGEEGRDPGQDYQIYERRLPRKLRDAWEVTEALIGASARRSASIGARLVVVGAPSFRQLDPDRFRQVLASEGLDVNRYDPEQPGRMLGEAAARQHVPYLDLLPALRQAQADGAGDQYFPRNTHWTAAGQTTVARAVYAFLNQTALVSQGSGQ
ncbi:MAG: hypothetical protein IT307_06285 [Chloroflexi bacterium]|nr:hypothetical protein [Chloroflexota bacterium]